MALDEVVQALHAPEGLRFERRVGELLAVTMGMSASGRVIAVICEQLDRTTTYRSPGARALAGTELDQWGGGCDDRS